MSSTSVNRIKDRMLKYFGMACMILGLLMLGIFLYTIFADGVSRINLSFLSNLPSRFPEKAGVLTALVGTAWIFVLTAIIAIPLGVAAGIYLEEYVK